MDYTSIMALFGSFAIVIAIFEAAKILPMSSTMTASSIAITLPGLIGTIDPSIMGLFIKPEFIGPIMAGVGFAIKYMRWRTDAPII